MDNCGKKRHVFAKEISFANTCCFFFSDWYLLNQWAKEMIYITTLQNTERICTRFINEREREGGNTVHLSDGILNMQTVAVTSAAAGVMLLYSLKGMKEEDIPKVSLATAAFFTASIITIPIGPSSVHAFLGGLIGILLGRRSTIAIFIGLLLQALFFQSGGLTTLGINTVIMTMPAFVSSYLFRKLIRKGKHVPIISGLLGAFSVIQGVSTFALFLYVSNNIYSEGVLSTINLLLLAHIPVVILEGILTMAVIGFIHKTRPGLLALSYGVEMRTEMECYENKGA